MRRCRVGVAVAAVLALPVPAAASLPRHGTLVPGRSLGGVRLGEPATQVAASLGPFRGVCEGCPTTTWYFTYKPYDARGLGVELTRGRVSAVYTLWQPDGWHGPRGLRLGVDETAAGALPIVACTGYGVFVLDGKQARTAYYTNAGRLWGFGLFPRGANPCR